MHMAASRQQTLPALVTEADTQRPVGRPLASTLRVLALQTGTHMHDIDTHNAQW